MVAAFRSLGQVIFINNPLSGLLLLLALLRQSPSMALFATFGIGAAHLAAMDLDGDGAVERAEFIEVMLLLRRLRDGQERLKRYLIPVDVDGDERLDPGEIDRLLGSIGQPPLNRRERQAVFGPELSGLSWHTFFDRLLLT